MTLWDAMLSLLQFFTTPAAMVLIGIVMIAAIVVTASIWGDLPRFSGRWFWLAIPVGFFALSLIVWGASSADAYEWVSRQ